MVGAEPPKVLRNRAAAELDLEVLREILEGGSSARVYQARTAEGEDMVLKVLGSGGPTVVDGHDLGSFRAKAEQIAQIRQASPQLGSRYLPITHSIDAGTWLLTRRRTTRPWIWRRPAGRAGSSGILRPAHPGLR